ncbi:phospholipase/carboxylesterase [Nocardioides ginsengisegetis]|uniref:Phospholipase/carboxylesterase n=1 Tax=Nocardioides ginsengisegetis TaxID=661491 RepID=A0A7W3IXJ8_9ACTN|nr:luciferase family protein [Nocardioides ginsengisegetis]MBA8802506.1 phospholipase/carboxylesterase [Nocardioides ginsengisegetis]
MSAATFAPPVVATHGSTDPTAPLVVLLHGRGSNENDIVGLAAHLPVGPAYAAVRAPIAEAGGFAWFANRGIGRPVADSLRSTMDWFRSWLDLVAPAGRPVVLVGFSGGAAFAGGLVLDDPARYAGAAILYGTLPFDAGLATEPGRLANLPVFVAQGDGDHVIPRELLDRTWSYLLSESGAPTVALRQPGGHQLTAEAVHQLGDWLLHRIAFVDHGTATPAGPPTDVAWPTLPGGVLPERRGDRPEVSWTIPQQQETQNAPAELQERLFDQVRQLAGVEVGPSRISVPGARGFTLREGSPDEQAFLVPQVGEFAHLHPAYDGSLHVVLPTDLAADVSIRGWGRPHMWAGTRLSPGFMLIHGPRDDDELAVVLGIVAASHAYATGTPA